LPMPLKCLLVYVSEWVSCYPICSVIATKAAQGIWSSQTSPAVAFTFANP
jgi:hypothetical protein